MNTVRGKYESQKKYMCEMKQLRVWVKADKYALLVQKAKRENVSIYGIINGFIDCYLKTQG